MAQASELAPGSKLVHPKFGTGMILSLDETYYKIYFYTTGEVKTLARDFEGFTVEEAKVPDFPMLTMKDVEKAIREALIQTSERAPIVPLGGRWMGELWFLNLTMKLFKQRKSLCLRFFIKL